MKISVKVQGKSNPIAVGGEKIRLSLSTQKINIVGDIIYQIFKGKEEKFDLLPLFERKSLERNVYFSYELFEDASDYTCRAKVSDGKGVYFSEPCYFTTGISHGNFSGKWIDNPDFDGHVSEFSKKFTVKEKPCRAYLYIVGLGFSDAYINGVKTDEFYFKPLLSDFDVRRGLHNPHYNEGNFGSSKKTVYYDTFDVTNLIKEGENTLRVLVGTGWYCNEDKNITDPSYTFDKPKLLYELRIKTDDGEKIVCSSSDDLVRNTNIKSQMFACDFIDFTEKKKAYKKARLCTPPSGELLPNPSDNDKVIEEIAPLSEKREGNFIEYDFGKNHSGSLKIKVKGKKGAKLIVNQYETKKNGELDPLTSRWPAYKDGLYIIGHLDQTSEYVLSGGVDEIIPYYHWSAYRWVTVECDSDFEIVEIKSLFITTDVAQDGEFTCSDEFLTRFNKMFVLTQRDNMHCGIPSDCPHREKLPYTGDGQLVAETVLYSLDTENFYRKWLKDIIDSQGKNGFVSNTAPIIAGGGGYWWSNALAVVPFVLYNFTGDKEILRDAFIPLKKLVKFYDSIHNGDSVMRRSYIKWFLGDWCTPDKTEIDISFVNTLAAYYATEKLLDAYEILGEVQGKEEFIDFKNRLKNAINEFYFDKATLDYAGGVQGANLMPALYGIANKEIAEKLLLKEAEKYEKQKHFDTGIVMTPVVLDVLSKVGREDIGYALLTEKTAPSFFNMLEGETTLPEHWLSHYEEKATISHCHPMFGSVLAWVYKNVGGLDLSKLAQKRIIVAPKLIKQVSSAKISKATEYGEASVSYSLCESFTMNLTVPFGLTAEVTLPEFLGNITVNGGEVKGKITLGGGEYVVSAKTI